MTLPIKNDGSGNQRLLGAIRREAPDLILVGGDMLIRSTGEKSEHAAAFLERLPAIAPVYRATGNQRAVYDGKKCERGLRRGLPKVSPKDWQIPNCTWRRTEGYGGGFGAAADARSKRIEIPVSLSHPTSYRGTSLGTYRE
ncbi:MAG: hypothetical protein ACLUUO_15950 [Sellimonas intestinalis]